MLEQSLRAGIEDFYFFVSGARRKARAVRVEGYVLNHALVVVEGVNQAAVCNIPQPQSPVIGSRGDHSRIKRKLRASDPV